MYPHTSLQLLEPCLAEDLVQYSLLSLGWLTSLLESGAEAAFASIPEYALTSSLTWLEWVIRGGQAVRGRQLFFQPPTCYH